MKNFPFVGVVILRFVHVCLESQDSSVGIATSLATEPRRDNIFSSS
jgi:hypothetical protein